MIPDAARMRRWMLLGAPMLLLSALGMHAGGAAAGMALWMGLGLKALPHHHYPYPRKRRGSPERLFLAFSAAVFLLGLFSFFGYMGGLSGFLHRLLWLWGGLCFSLSISGKILTLAISRKFCLWGGLMLIAPGLFFIFYRQ